MDALDVDEAIAILSEAPVAHLGMIDDGRPYVTPMSFVADNDRILFRTMPGRKLEILRHSPPVCVEVSLYDEETGDWASVVVNGTARVIEDDPTKTEVISQLFRKYERVMGSPLSRGGGLQPLEGIPHVFEVEIDEISGLVSGRGWSRRTRPGRL